MRRTTESSVAPGDLVFRTRLYFQRMNPEDQPLTGTYVKVMLLEAAIIAALWVIGRLFS